MIRARHLEWSENRVGTESVFSVLSQSTCLHLTTWSGDWTLGWDLVSIPLMKSSLAWEPSVYFFPCSTLQLLQHILRMSGLLDNVKIMIKQRSEGQLLRQDSNKPQMCTVLIHTYTSALENCSQQQLKERLPVAGEIGGQCCENTLFGSC